MKSKNYNNIVTKLEGFVEGSLGHIQKSVLQTIKPYNFPLMINIEPTSDCNLKCSICPRQKSKKAVGYMKYDLYTKIIDEIADNHQLYMLNFHKDGEPLLHKDLCKMIRYAKTKKISKYIHFNTNGVLLNEDNSKLLCESGIDDITVSIDAFSEESYKKLKGLNLLKTVETNVKRFFEIRKKYNFKKPFLRVKIIDCELTKNEIKDFINKWENIADEVQVSGIHNWGESISIDQTINIPSKRFPCIYLWYAIAINHNGGVNLCCVDWKNDGTLGNISNDSIKNIWKSKTLKQIRKFHIDSMFDKVKECKNCSNWAGGENLRDWMIKEKEFYTTRA